MLGYPGALSSLKRFNNLKWRIEFWKGIIDLPGHVDVDFGQVSVTEARWPSPWSANALLGRFPFLKFELVKILKEN